MAARIVSDADGGSGSGSPSDLSIGRLLLDQGLIDQPALERALASQARYGGRLGEILMAAGAIRAIDFYGALARQKHVPFIDLMRLPPDPRHLREADLDRYVADQCLPWRSTDGHLVHVTTDPQRAAEAFRRRGQTPPLMVITSKFDILWTLQRIFGPAVSRRSVSGLAEADPESSALEVITSRQVIVAWVLLSALLGSLYLFPMGTLIAVNVAAAVLFLSTFVFKLALTLISTFVPKLDQQVTDEEVAALSDDDLPVYTVLVPMYREPEVLPLLTEAIRNLDYPKDKLDVKLILEEDDDLTINKAKSLGLEAIFEIVRVPVSQPKTKPKACNYAIPFSRGDYLVIYDAEDHPEPDQLKKAIIGFRKSSPDTACLQARLSYFNNDENWLTRLFTIDYTLWFDYMLPALDFLKMPIPLGGTSNHFDLKILREMGAWDPYNVTEDADLGVRLTRKGYRVGIINSTTYEEANARVGNWIRQRSRWMKGYMQTWLVHMRRPVHLFRTIGWWPFLGFQFFIGGSILIALLSPLYWVIFGVWLTSKVAVFDLFFPDYVAYISLFNLLAGNLVSTYIAVLAPLKRGYFHLIPYGLTVFGYWALVSIATVKGAIQLITKPFYWEKTQHGISTQIADRLSSLENKKPGQ